MRRGFTLLELVLVVGILAAVAGSLIVALGGVEQQTERDVLRHEMAQVQAALLRFRDDTGYLLKQGPFDLETRTGGRVGLASLPAVAGGDDTARTAWFDSPANLHQLLAEPRQGDGTPVLPWNPDARRGWRGPYLRAQGEGWVQVGDGLTPDGGDPTQGTLRLVPGVADPFPFAPADNGALTWYTSDLPGATAQARFGRPYVLQLEAGGLPATDLRLVSFGPDGVLDTSDDVSLYVVR